MEEEELDGDDEVTRELAVQSCMGNNLGPEIERKLTCKGGIVYCSEGGGEDQSGMA